MKARFTRPFGHFASGAEIELPDGCEFDHSYLEEVAEVEEVVNEEPKAKAEAPKEGDK